MSNASALDAIRQLVRTVNLARQINYNDAKKRLSIGNTTLEDYRKYVNSLQGYEDQDNEFRKDYIGLPVKCFSTADDVLSGTDGGVIGAYLPISLFLDNYTLPGMAMSTHGLPGNKDRLDYHMQAYAIASGMSINRSTHSLVQAAFLKDTCKLRADGSWDCGNAITNTLSAPGATLQDLSKSAALLSAIRGAGLSTRFDDVGSASQRSRAADSAEAAKKLLDEAASTLDTAWAKVTRAAIRVLASTGISDADAHSKDIRKACLTADKDYTTALNGLRESAGDLMDTWMKGFQ